jgi:hypothetical protein
VKPPDISAPIVFTTVFNAPGAKSVVSHHKIGDTMVVYDKGVWHTNCTCLSRTDEGVKYEIHNNHGNHSTHQHHLVDISLHLTLPPALDNMVDVQSETSSYCLVVEWAGISTRTRTSKQHQQVQRQLERQQQQQQRKLQQHQHELLQQQQQALLAQAQQLTDMVRCSFPSLAAANLP